MWLSFQTVYNGRSKNRGRTGLQKFDTRFRSGVSGNPRGRPKSDPAVRDAARARTLEAVDTLVEIMRTGKPADQLTAAVALLDRGWGRPTNAVTVQSDNKISLVDLLVELNQIHEFELPGGCQAGSA
jgi:hypothetical protein